MRSNLSLRMRLDHRPTDRINALGTVARTDTDIMVVAEPQTIVPVTMTTVVAVDEANSLETVLFGKTRAIAFLEVEVRR